MSDPTSPPDPAPAPASAPPSRGAFLLGLLRDWGFAIVVVLVALATWNLLFGARPPPLGPAPDFVLRDLDGRDVELSAIGGASDLVVLNFWFTACRPCRTEIPELTKFHVAHPEVPLYGVSTDTNLPLAALKHASERLGIRYPVLHDARGQVASAYGVQVFPTTVVLREGRIVQAHVGVLNHRGLEQLVAASEVASALP